MPPTRPWQRSRLKVEHLTAAELAVENVPPADEAEQAETETIEEDEAAKEDGA